MTSEVALCTFGNSFAALKGVILALEGLRDRNINPTQATRTHFGSVVLGSLTFTKPNCIRPSENSSIRSTSSPSVLLLAFEYEISYMRQHTSCSLQLHDALLSTILLKCANQRSGDRVDSPLAISRRRRCRIVRRRRVDNGLVALCD